MSGHPGIGQTQTNYRSHYNSIKMIDPGFRQVALPAVTALSVVSTDAVSPEDSDEWTFQAQTFVDQFWEEPVKWHMDMSITLPDMFRQWLPPDYVQVRVVLEVTMDVKFVDDNAPPPVREYHVDRWLAQPTQLHAGQTHTQQDRTWHCLDIWMGYVKLAVSGSWQFTARMEDADWGGGERIWVNIRANVFMYHSLLQIRGPKQDDPDDWHLPNPLLYEWQDFHENMPWRVVDMFECQGAQSTTQSSPVHKTLHKGGPDWVFL